MVLHGSKNPFIHVSCTVSWQTSKQDDKMKLHFPTKQIPQWINHSITSPTPHSHNSQDKNANLISAQLQFNAFIGPFGIQISPSEKIPRLLLHCSNLFLWCHWDGRDTIYLSSGHKRGLCLKQEVTSLLLHYLRVIQDLIVLEATWLGYSRDLWGHWLVTSGDDWQLCKWGDRVMFDFKICWGCNKNHMMHLSLTLKT